MATYSRCTAILHNDASSETQEKLSPGFHELLSDISITSFGDLQQRSERVKEFLPRLWEVAETIMSANPGIED